MPQVEQIAYDDSDPSNPYRDDRPLSPRPTSGLAIASFVCGLFFLFPLIPSTLAVVFGIVALRNMRFQYVGGRLWAIWGIILGAAGLVIWIFVGAAMVMMIQMIFSEQSKAQVVASQFVQELSEGKVDAAAKYTSNEVTRESLQSAVEVMQGNGPFNELIGQSFPIQIPGTLKYTFQYEGQIIFSRARKSISMSLFDEGEGVGASRYKIDTFRIR